MSTIRVLDGAGVDKYYRVQGVGSEAEPFQHVSMNYSLASAIQQIKSDDGVDVSVFEKSKGLRKFGRNETVGTSFETVGEFQGSTANETFLTTNIIDSIVSDSASDTSQTIVIEGHTVDGSGNLTFVTQEADLNGQTEVTLTTAMARANRAYVKNSGTFGTTPSALVGDVYIYDNTDGITSGVPDTAAATKLMITAGNTQSQKAGTSISSLDYYIIENFSAAVGVSGGSASRVEVVLETRDVKNGGAWRPVGRNIEIDTSQNGVQIKFEPLLIIKPNHDVRAVAKVNSNTAEVTAMFSGYLAIIT